MANGIDPKTKRPARPGGPLESRLAPRGKPRLVLKKAKPKRKLVVKTAPPAPAAPAEPAFFMDRTHRLQAFDAAVSEETEVYVAGQGVPDGWSAGD